MNSYLVNIKEGNNETIICYETPQSRYSKNVLVNKTFDLINPPKECKNYMVVCTCGLQKKLDKGSLAIGTVTECETIHTKAG